MSINWEAEIKKAKMFCTQATALKYLDLAEQILKERNEAVENLFCMVNQHCHDPKEDGRLNSYGLTDNMMALEFLERMGYVSIKKRIGRGAIAEIVDRKEG